MTSVMKATIALREPRDQNPLMMSLANCVQLEATAWKEQLTLVHVMLENSIHTLVDSLQMIALLAGQDTIVKDLTILSLQTNAGKAITVLQVHHRQQTLQPQDITLLRDLTSSTSVLEVHTTSLLNSLNALRVRLGIIAQTMV